ncbi:MAG: Hsp70 family protein, partial [Myxococcales bacterium]
VPASFDEVARELTLRAAAEAGLGKLTLVEEPQAAFYDWTRRHRGNLKEVLAGTRFILVVDVGGGTTDLTLIHCAVEGLTPKLDRIAVGEHLLLGGDNMDVALARRVEGRLGARLDAAQWSMLVQSCRLAKETVLSPGGPAKTTLSVVGRGSRLIGSALSAEVSREEVLEVVLEGFFPRTRADELPARGARGALQELGLPYASEPAVTRHVGAFLRSHANEVNARTGRQEALPRPDAILLNGGVFHPIEVGERLLEAVSGWFPEQPKLGLLETDSLDVAVARGAAYYAMVRRGLGLRIGGGSARAYFVGIEAGQGKQALCVIPREMEERERVDVARTFALTLDRPVSFPLYATTLSRGEKPGDVVPFDEEAFQELPPIQTVLRSGAARDKQAQKAVEIPVRLEAALTEIGTLELWCVATDRDARWKLEFQLRGAAAEEAASAVAPMPKRFDEAKELIDLVYGKKPVQVEKKDVKNLVRNLEKVLGPREGWTTPVIRELWATLYAGMAKRRRTADHERI